MITLLLSGFPKIGLAAVDPLHVNQIQLKQGAQSPVNIELNFRDVDLLGLKDHVCTYMKQVSLTLKQKCRFVANDNDSN